MNAPDELQALADSLRPRVVSTEERVSYRDKLAEARNRPYAERRAEAMSWCAEIRVIAARGMPLPFSVRLIENLVAAADRDLEQAEAAIARAGAALSRWENFTRW